jgi:hypothetical protein
MNNNFDINRFGLLIRHQWIENKKSYILLWGVISLSLIILVLEQGKIDNAFMLLPFWFGGCFVINTVFSRWSNFGTSSTYLLVPASATEKFLCGLFYGIILYIPAYCLNYFITTYIFTYLIFSPFANGMGSLSGIITEALNEIKLSPFRLWMVYLLSMMFMQSIYAIIAIYFRKRHVLIFLFIIFGILVFYNTGIDILINRLVNAPRAWIRPPGLFLPFLTPDFAYAKSSVSQLEADYFSFTRLIRDLNILGWLIVFSILYFSAWFKLREREL